MMDHDRADDLVLDLAEGTLGPALRDEVRAHTERCGTCRESIARLALARRIAAHVARELASTGVHESAPPSAIDVQVLTTAFRDAASRRAVRRKVRRRRALALAAVAGVLGTASIVASGW